MFFNWGKKKKEKALANCKSAIILTNLHENEVAYLSQHPDDRSIVCQIVTPLAVIDDNKQVSSAKISFWRDGEIFKNLKPGTIYKAYYKNFEAPDSRVGYPNSYYLESLEEYTENDDYVKALVKEAVLQEKELAKAKALRAKDEKERFDEATKKVMALQKERTFDYKGTKFVVDVCDGIGSEVNEDDEYEGEKEIIATFVKQKDAIIEEAIRGAFEEQFDNAKEWIQNPNLTKEEFVANLLANPFEVFIPETDVYNVLFNPANGMIPDSICSYFGCVIRKGSFATTDFGV